MTSFSLSLIALILILTIGVKDEDKRKKRSEMEEKAKCPKCKSTILWHSTWEQTDYDWYCISCYHTFYQAKDKQVTN